MAVKHVGSMLTYLKECKTVLRSNGTHCRKAMTNGVAAANRQLTCQLTCHLTSLFFVFADSMLRTSKLLGANLRFSKHKLVEVSETVGWRGTHSLTAQVGGGKTSRMEDPAQQTE